MENFYTLTKNIVSKLNTNKLVIIGKGPSISKFELEKLKKECIIVNLNDSERLISGHFCILHRAWAYQSVKDNGFKDLLYLSDLDVNNNKNIIIDYKPSTYDSIEQIINIFKNENIYITDFLFITALKLALIISDIISKKLEVYFIGFDFGFSKNINQKSIYPINDDLTFKKVFLQTQEKYFEEIKKYFEKNINKVKIFHVGDKRFSDISIEQFNNKDVFSDISIRHIPLKFNSNLYKKLLQKSKKGHVLIVAELTNNHLGDINRLKEMVSLAKKAGADLIKVQKRDVLSFYTNTELNSEYKSVFGTTLKDYRQGVEMDDKMFEILSIECYKHNIPWFVSVLDGKSLTFLKKYDIPLLKIPSTISNHRNFIKKFALEFDGDIVVSTGFTDVEYENFIFDLFNNKNTNLWMLQCTSSYPAPPEACQISVVRHYNEIGKSKNILAGYSSHDVGSLGSMLAVAAGAKMIEKHVKLGDVSWVHFDGVAVDLYTDSFKDFVSEIRKAEIMCGSEIKKIHTNEHHKYRPNKNHN